MSARSDTAVSAVAEVPIRTAASVVLVRDGANGIEAWLLSRAAELSFAAGVTAFPGGRVEDDDAEICPPDTPLSQIADAFGCPRAVAREVVGAAVRETFEETGVLLTAPSMDLRHLHPAVNAGTLAFRSMLHAHRLVPDTSALLPWAHWVTPPGRSRRYDTYFFVAAPPALGTAANVTSEASAADWLSVSEALEQHAQGHRAMMLPTVSVLRRLAQHRTVAEIVSTRGRTVPLVAPQRRSESRAEGPVPPAPAGVVAD